MVTTRKNRKPSLGFLGIEFMRTLRKNSTVRKCEKCKSNYRILKEFVGVADRFNFCWSCKLVSTPCDGCGKMIFKQPPHNELEFCNEDCRKSHLMGEAAKESTRLWVNRCPDLYKETDPEKLPDFEAFETVLCWKYNRTKGLVLNGATGLGKTRAAWALLRKLAEQGFYFAAIRGLEFSKRVHQSTKPGGDGDLDEWLPSLRDADVLLVDEIDKLNWAPRATAEFFELIEYRTSNRMPVIYTTNETSADLLKKLPANTGPALIRRIKEFTRQVEFKRPATAKPS